MKNLLLCYILFHILFQSSFLIDLWNFKNASDNLLNPENEYKHSFEIYSHSDTKFDVSLRKNINKNNDKIIDTNILEVKEKINSIKYSFNVEFEDILIFFKGYYIKEKIIFYIYVQKVNFILYISMKLLKI